MANAWFRMYAEFATDPKVQMLSEVEQRRFIMALCLRCSNEHVTLHDEEVAFQLRISNDEWLKTKQILVAKGLLDSENAPTNWDKRQYVSDSSAERVARHRERKKQEKQECNVTVTPPDTDTDTEEEAKASVASKLPTCPTQSVIDLYHEVLPELPSVRLLNDQRRKAISNFWRWVLTSKRRDGTPRAQTADQALTWISGYFARAKHNDFLMGRVERNEMHHGWRCDLDFLLTEKGKKHVIEKTEAAA